MKTPSAYMDIRVAHASHMQQLMHVLHGISRTQQGRFALAFPRLKMGTARSMGSAVRVFADDADDLADLSAELAGHAMLAGGISLKQPALVPADFNGPWKEYRRVRVPGNGSRLEKCREYRLNRVESLPHFRTFSKSTGQPFVVFVEERPGDAARVCLPDSYGLSLPSRAFALPDLP